MRRSVRGLVSGGLPVVSAVAACIALLGALSANAQRRPRGDNPYDAEARRLASEVRRRHGSARAVLPLLELWANVDHSSAAGTEALLAGLARDRGVPAPLRAYAATRHAWMLHRLGKLDEAATRIVELGYVQRWRVVGAFDNEGKAGFDRSMPPEDGRNAPADLDAPMQGRERAVAWRTPPDVVRQGYVSFDALLRPTENVCGFAETFVHVERARPLTVWAGAGGAIKVYWNGEPVIVDAAYRDPDPDRFVGIVAARAGWNRVLVKDCCLSGRWGFYLRIGEADGGPPREIRVDPAGAAVADAPAAAITLPRAPVAPLAALEAAAAVEPPNAGALEDLARFLSGTGADDPAERRARGLSQRAAELDPNVDRLLLASDLAEERAERMAHVARALAMAPDDPRVLLYHATFIRWGFEPERCLGVLEKIPERTPAGFSAAMDRASILAGYGLAEAGVALAARLAKRAPDAPQVLRLHASLLQSADHVDEAWAVRQDVLAVQSDDLDTRRALAGDALARDDRPEVLRQIEAMRALTPDSASTLGWAARQYDALAQEGDAIAARQAALDLAPDDPDAHVALAHALLDAGRRDSAAASLRHALELRPQDAAVREEIEHLRPERRPDEDLATATEEVLARRRRKGGGWSVRILQDLTVQTVHDNGLGSTFRQIAAQVHDDEGARRWRRYAIGYDPSSQWVDVRLARVYRADGTVLESSGTSVRDVGESWYRIYFDRSELSIVFPDLEPSDVVEIRYRIDDVSHRNVFADYYGDLHLLQGGDPVVHHEYVLLSPAARQIHVNEPRMPRLEHTRRVDGTRRIDVWRVDDVPALRGEAGMPGATEVVPYLHVSTYREWRDVGRWWWGLVQDQLQTDATLRARVAELVRGAPDVRTKVQRIFAWVARSTRYVGLEFGIHGFLPYRVPLVVQRGFGDCKDTASLLYAMLREAGIDARIALVRTRDNGAIEGAPASLAAFDHAIAYVPELDLYLDGTTDTSGSTELPEADQGVSVLVIGPDTAELRTTPVTSADSNRRTLSLHAELAADGSARLRAEDEIKGTRAAFFRTTYQAEGQRAERLERSLAGLFPGMQLESQSFTALDDSEVPVRYRWEGRAPQLARRDGSVLRLAPTILADLLQSLATAPTRRYPLDLGSPWSFVEERTVVLPAGARAGELPAAADVSSEFGRLRVTVRSDGRSIVARSEISVTRDRIATAEYPAFRRWVERVDEALRARIEVVGAR